MFSDLITTAESFFSLIGYIVGAAYGVFQLLNYFNSRAAKRNSNVAKEGIRILSDRVGEPDASKQSLTSGTTLTQKLESVVDNQAALARTQAWLVDSYKRDMDNLRQEQIAFMRDQVIATTRNNGRHSHGDNGDNPLGAGTQEDVGRP